MRVKCDECGKLVSKPASRIKKDKRNFCDMHCYTVWKKNNNKTLSEMNKNTWKHRRMQTRERLTFVKYQLESRETAIYPNIGHDYVYPVLGLCGEAGEVAEKIKKIIRDDKGVISDNKRKELKKELGDVLWYISNLAVELNLSLEDIAIENLNKLFSRQNRKVLRGSGDNR